MTELAAEDEVLEKKAENNYYLSVRLKGGITDRFWLTEDELSGALRRLKQRTQFQFGIYGLMDKAGDTMYIPSEQIVSFWWREHDNARNRG